MSQPSIDLQAYLNTHQLLRDAIEGLGYEQLHWKAAPINGVLRRFCLM